MDLDWIVSRPDVLAGKPCVRGTRLSVQFLLELSASGADRQSILSAYPQLSEPGLNAAFDYAARALHDELVIPAVES